MVLRARGTHTWCAALLSVGRQQCYKSRTAFGNPCRSIRRLSRGLGPGRSVAQPGTVAVRWRDSVPAGSELAATTQLGDVGSLHAFHRARWFIALSPTAPNPPQPRRPPTVHSCLTYSRDEPLIQRARPHAPGLRFSALQALGAAERPCGLMYENRAQQGGGARPRLPTATPSRMPLSGSLLPNVGCERFAPIRNRPEYLPIPSSTDRPTSRDATRRLANSPQ